MHIIVEAYGKYGIMVACKSHTGHTDICMEYHTESHDTKYHKMPQNAAKNHKIMQKCNVVLGMWQCHLVYERMSLYVYPNVGLHHTAIKPQNTG